MWGAATVDSRSTSICVLSANLSRVPPCRSLVSSHLPSNHSMTITFLELFSYLYLTNQIKNSTSSFRAVKRHPFPLLLQSRLRPFPWEPPGPLPDPCSSTDASFIIAPTSPVTGKPVTPTPGSTRWTSWGFLLCEIQHSFSFVRRHAPTQKNCLRSFIRKVKLQLCRH